MKTADITIDHHYTTPPSNPGIEYHGIIAASRQILELWQQRSRGRRALRHLSQHYRKDIGISHDDAIFEADKLFWQK